MEMGSIVSGVTQDAGIIAVGGDETALGETEEPCKLFEAIPPSRYPSGYHVSHIFRLHDKILDVYIPLSFLRGSQADVSMGPLRALSKVEWPRFSKS